MVDSGNEDVDFRIMELIVSRLCHDLVSPVGAVNNGVELIDELGDDVVEDAMGLIGQSARIASSRLALFRFAYGMAGVGTRVSWREIRSTADAYLGNGKTTLVWPSEAETTEAASPDIQRYAGKLLLNMMLLAEETLPSGGRIVVAMNDREIVVTATGRAAHLSDEHQMALLRRGPVEQLTARSVHAYVVGHYASLAGMTVRQQSKAADSGNGTVGETLTLTATFTGP